MTTSIVTNHSDLSPGAKALLLAGTPDAERITPHTKSLDILVQRGLAVRTGVRDTGRYRLTDKGAAAAAQLQPIAAPSVDARLYDAVRAASPTLTRIARYIAECRQWSTKDPINDWDKGWTTALSMVADQLECDVLGELAPLLIPEANRRARDDAAHLAATPRDKHGEPVDLTDGDLDAGVTWDAETPPDPGD